MHTHISNSQKYICIVHVLISLSQRLLLQASSHFRHEIVIQLKLARPVKVILYACMCVFVCVRLLLCTIFTYFPIITVDLR